MPPRSFAPFLLLLFIGTICSSMIVPFMGFFLVEGLGRPPWMFSVYAGTAVTVTVLTNRRFARAMDAGAPVLPFVTLAAGCYVMATLSLSLVPTWLTVLSIGALCFGLSSSAVSTMFGLGGNWAERLGVDRARSNAWMRATTSTAWMIGPAVGFQLAHVMGPKAVFPLALMMGLVWLGLLRIILPRDLAARPKDIAAATARGTRNVALILAAGFAFCLSSAHSLTFSALPLFYVQEVGLPGYAPGLAFSMKTFVEIFAILSTPWLIARFGLRWPLIGTSCLAVLTIQLLAMVSSFPQMLAAAALEGLYYGLYASIGLSYVQSFAPERPAQATALYWNVLIVSGLLAGPVVGAIAQIWDFHAVILTASGVAALAVVVLILGTMPGRARPGAHRS